MHSVDMACQIMERVANWKKPTMATWVKCIDEHGQTIYANLDNAITLFRD